MRNEIDGPKKTSPWVTIFHAWINGWKTRDYDLPLFSTLHGSRHVNPGLSLSRVRQSMVWFLGLRVPNVPDDGRVRFL